MSLGTVRNIIDYVCLLQAYSLRNFDDFDDGSEDGEKVIRIAMETYIAYY
jgi:hypothetical protein